MTTAMINAARRRCPVMNSILPKPGWAIAHSAHPSPTCLDVVGFTYEAVNERMLVKILRATQHITVGQYFDFVQHSPPICTVWTVNDVLVDPYPFHAGIDQAVHVPLYLLNFCPMKNQIKSFFYREPLWSYTYLQPFHFIISLFHDQSENLQAVAMQ